MGSAILVADVADLDAWLARALAAHRLRFVRTVEEALRALGGERFDLLIIGVQFDDSRMFDLLRWARSQGRLDDLPVLCLRQARGALLSFSANILEVACRALRADAFVDLSSAGEEAARTAALREAVEALLARRSG